MIPPNSDDPAWVREAKRDLGVREGRDDKRILAMRRWTNERPWAGTSGAGSAWCSDSLNAWFGQAGIAGTGSAGAASWKRWGQPCKPQPGAVVVFGPSDPDSGGTGHVALVLDPETGLCISGNCGNAVRIKAYDLGKAVACRWPLIP